MASKLSLLIQEKIALPPGARKKIIIWFCIALLLRWIFSLIYAAPLYSDMKRYDILASAIVRGRFSHEHIYRPYLYPIFLASIYRVFGIGTKGYLAARLIQGVISAISCWLVFKIAEYFAGWRVAYLSYVITVFYIPYVTFSSVLLTETLYTFFLLLTIYCLLVFANFPRTKHIVLAGIFAGLTSLTRSTFLAIIPFIALWLLFSLKQGAKKTAIYFSCFCLTSLIVLSPHMVMSGKINPTSYNGGDNFAIGAGVPFADRAKIYRAVNEGLPLAKASKIFYKMGWEKINQNPFHYLGRMLNKFVKFFVSKDYYPFFQYHAGTTQLELAQNPNNKIGFYVLHSLYTITRISFVFLILPAALMTFFFIKQEKEARTKTAFHLLGLVIFSYTLLHLFFIVRGPRMRMPLDALFIVLFAYVQIKILDLFKFKKAQNG